MPISSADVQQAIADGLTRRFAFTDARRPEGSMAIGRPPDRRTRAGSTGARLACGRVKSASTPETRS